MPTDRLLPAALYEIGKLIGSEPDPGILVRRAGELLGPLVDAGACTIMLLDADRRRLLARPSPGPRAERAQWLSLPADHGVPGWAIAHGEPVLIDDVTRDPRASPAVAGEPHTGALLCIPLTVRGDRIGVIVATGAPGQFTAADLAVLGHAAATVAADLEQVRIQRVAVTDPLTGAYHRDYLLQRLPQEIEAAGDREGALSIAMVDVDHFKTVNDRYGHAIGDAVLSEVARRLRGAIRPDDLLVRYGGEEFLVVLPRACAGRAWEIGERMRQRVSERAFDLGDGLALLLRVSVGVAQWHPGEPMSELIDRAITAVHGAKDRGRNRVEVSP